MFVLVWSAPCDDFAAPIWCWKATSASIGHIGSYWKPYLYACCRCNDWSHAIQFHQHICNICRKNHTPFISSAPHDGRSMYSIQNTKGYVSRGLRFDCECKKSTSFATVSRSTATKSTNQTWKAPELSMRRGGITELLGISRSAVPPLLDTIDTASSCRSQQCMSGQRAIVANVISRSPFPDFCERQNVCSFYGKQINRWY